jgi:hypothetical protein
MKHGHNKRGQITKTYRCWVDLRKRCFNPRRPEYPNYGGRGITVCERWNSFPNFLADMGEMPLGLSIDRINNDGNYEPSNCRWATRSEQMKNRRASSIARGQYRFINLGQESRSVGEWDRFLGLAKGGVWHRLQNGWPLAVALTTPNRRTA